LGGAGEMLFPNDWRVYKKYREKLIRVLCFGAVFNSRDKLMPFRRLNSWDDNNLAILFYLLSEYSDDELRSSSYFKDRYTSKISNELRRQCSTCSNRFLPCSTCVAKARMSAEGVSSECL
jgi:hypothetical protein